MSPCHEEWDDFFTKMQYKTHLKILCFHRKLFVIFLKPKWGINYWTLSGYGWNFWGSFDSICLRKCLHFAASWMAISRWLHLALYQTLVCSTAGKRENKYFYDFLQRCKCWDNLEILTRSPRMHLRGGSVQRSGDRWETRSTRNQK